MGALPSKESHEAPSSVYFANTGSQVIVHLPLTPHFFPHHDCLAFRQLHDARNHQSALYAFEVPSVEGLLPAPAAEAFYRAQDEDWGPELDEVDPSLCYDSCAPLPQPPPRHLRRALEAPEELYAALVTAPTAGQLVATDAAMREVQQQEQRWLAARDVLQRLRRQHGTGEDEALLAEDADARAAAAAVPPPALWLRPLPEALAVRLTSDEVEAQRRLFLRRTRCGALDEQHVGDGTHENADADPDAEGAVRPSGGILANDSGSDDERKDDADDEPLRMVRRRRLRFELDPRYRDGRVHLVEEDGVLFFFAYKIASDGGGAAGSTASAASAASPPVSDAEDQYVEEPCLHHSLKPIAGSDGRAGRCESCGARVRRHLRERAIRSYPATATWPGAAQSSFAVPITAVRVIGLSGPLPAQSRGSPWLRGCSDAPDEDATREALPQPPPILRLCRFIHGDFGEKLLSRAALVTLLTYRGRCERAGLAEMVARPLWTMCPMANIPYVQLVRETFFRAKAAVAEVDDGNTSLRRWIDEVDDENNFLNFINTNLGVFQRPPLPEATRRGDKPPSSRGSPMQSSAAAVAGAGGDRRGPHKNDDAARRSEGRVARVGRPEGRGPRDGEDEDDEDYGIDDDGGALPPPADTTQTRSDGAHSSAPPPRPDVQLFSSRLEPHVPVALHSLYHHDPSEDCTHNYNGLPSYVQQEVLLENQRELAEPREQRRLSHALYECGMVSTPRGRQLLFSIREDCLRALLYYGAVAAAPIFIGAYIEPVDTTTVSYGGAVRLHRPHGAQPAEEGGMLPWATLDGAQHIHVIREYFKRGHLTVFCVADLSAQIAGRCAPSAAHRLTKLVLPPPGDAADTALERQQCLEREQHGHVLTYAGDTFVDGDLVVFNAQEGRWEHYEHAQLRQRFREHEAARSLSGRSTPSIGGDGVDIASRRGSLTSDEDEDSPSLDAASWSRLLNVALDELLLSWTKWVVDNRFFEARSDPGWLHDPQSPTHLVQRGRYFVWSFRHNHQRYFFGVIPKFVRDRQRRQRLQQRQREKRAAQQQQRQQQREGPSETSVVSASPATSSARGPSAGHDGAASPSVVVQPMLSSPSASRPMAPVRQTGFRPHGSQRQPQTTMLPDVPNFSAIADYYSPFSGGVPATHLMGPSTARDPPPLGSRPDTPLHQRNRNSGGNCGYAPPPARSSPPLSLSAVGDVVETLPAASLRAPHALSRSPWSGVTLTHNPSPAPRSGDNSSDYYRHSGNTFIQDNKRHEREYYPPLPLHRGVFNPPTLANGSRVRIRISRGPVQLQSPLHDLYLRGARGPRGSASSVTSNTGSTHSSPPPLPRSDSRGSDSLREGYRWSPYGS